MLENGKILEVIALLESRRFSMRQIARQTGISRGSISSIFRNMEQEKRRITQRFDVVPSGPFQRCSGCGAKTKLPCLSCEIKKWMGKRPGKKVKQEVSGSGEHLEINLKSNHLKRYLKIKRWRDKQENPYFTIIPENWPWRK